MTFNASDFQASDGGPGYYTPFDDSTQDWNKARAFIDWLSKDQGMIFGIRSGFNEANRLARQHREKYQAWKTLQRLRGE